MRDDIKYYYFKSDHQNLKKCFNGMSLQEAWNRMGRLDYDESITIMILLIVYGKCSIQH